MRCIICKVLEKAGIIKHAKGCPEYFRPNHTTIVRGQKHEDHK